MATPGTSDRPTGPAAWPEHIQQRYGVRRRPRWVGWVLGLLLVGAVAVVTVVGVRLGTPAVDAGVLSYDTQSDEALTVRFELVRPETTPATCVLRARAADGYDVGYAVVGIPPARGRTTHEYTLRTAYRAIIGEVLGCGTSSVPPGVTDAQFRPGVVPPAQPWTP